MPEPALEQYRENNPVMNFRAFSTAISVAFMPRIISVFRKMTRRHTIDVLTATASDLRKLLDSGEVSSVELVGLYLGQIARHNKQGLMLNAMISTASANRVLEEARMLDSERAQKGPRSKLHGIPIILKVR
jgi:hypothetical protein